VHFLIADTFTSSLGKLTDNEQKQVKTSAFDMQMNPANPGLQFHKLNAARDPNFWSVRVNRDIRIIVHRSDNRLLLCYVDHHDDAYKWGERRKLETHPKTGAAQLVEVRETVKEIVVPTYVDVPEEPVPQVPALSACTADELLNFGVPEDWIPDLLVANEDQILEIVDHLPAEAAEAVIELAAGGSPAIPDKPKPDEDPFDHPDTFRRFRVVEDAEMLAIALDYPWEKWTVFLHPSQKAIVEKKFNGPARVSGSAGTGKTIVALHRAVFLARQDHDARILLTTFSDPLARNLEEKLRILCGSSPRLRERVEVASLNSVALRLAKSVKGMLPVAEENTLLGVLTDVLKGCEYSELGSEQFVIKEWLDVVDAWQLDSWDAYRNFKRLGRKTRLAENKRERLWAVFERFAERLAAEGLQTFATLLNSLSKQHEDRIRGPYDYIVIDEAQDISPMQLKFAGSVASQGQDNLFFAGDLGQRIFQTPFSWASLGVDIRGRARSLKINYRTSHQIRRQADRLLDPKIIDVDGNAEDRSGTISVFNGARPIVDVFGSTSEESQRVSNWLRELIDAGVKLQEIGIFVRSGDEISRAKNIVDLAGLESRVLDDKAAVVSGCVTISTMHLAKGLEFRYVAVVACDDEVIPSQARIEEITDQADLEEVYNTERHLLYVACTRARDGLIVTGVDPESEFLHDLV